MREAESRQRRLDHRTPDAGRLTGGGSRPDMRPNLRGSRMRPQVCGCRHLCQYAAENGLDPNLARLRNWCCICDDRTPCVLCAPRDTPERRQHRDRRLEKARRIVRPGLEPTLNEIEMGIESRRRLGSRLPWLPVDQIGRILRIAAVVVLCFAGVVMVFAVQSALRNWTPLWARLYAACMAQRPTPNTLAEMVQHRIACATSATDTIRKQR